MSSTKTTKSPAGRRSESPKKGRGPTEDDLLLETRMHANVVEQPTGQFLGLGFAISLLPVYLAIYRYDIALTVTSVALFAAVSGAVTYMLAQAYGILFFSEFMKRDSPYSEIKSQSDANLLRSLRLELSMSRAVFQANVVFVALSSAMQMYVFKNMDPRAAYLLAPLFAGIVSWFVAFKNEESRKAALRGPARD